MADYKRKYEKSQIRIKRENFKQLETFFNQTISAQTKFFIPINKLIDFKLIKKSL